MISGNSLKRVVIGYTKAAVDVKSQSLSAIQIFQMNQNWKWKEFKTICLLLDLNLRQCGKRKTPLLTWSSLITRFSQEFGEVLLDKPISSSHQLHYQI